MSEDQSDHLMELAWSFEDLATHLPSGPENLRTLLCKTEDGIRQACAYLSDERCGPLANWLQEEYDVLARQATALDQALGQKERSQRRSAAQAQEQAFRGLVYRLGHVLLRIYKGRLFEPPESPKQSGTVNGPALVPRRYATFGEATPTELLAALADWLKHPHLIKAAIANRDEDAARRVWIDSLQAGAIAQMAATDSGLSPNPISDRDFGLEMEMADAGFIDGVGSDIVSDLPEGLRQRTRVTAESRSSVAAMDVVDQLQSIYQAKALAANTSENGQCRRETPTWQKEIAERVHQIAFCKGGLAVFHDRMRECKRKGESQQKKHLRWHERRLRLIKALARLPEDHGRRLWSVDPPREGLVWTDGAVRHRASDDKQVEGYLTEEWGWEYEPEEARNVLDLVRPDCVLSTPQKYMLLAAVHDAVLGGVEKLDLWPIFQGFADIGAEDAVRQAARKKYGILFPFIVAGIVEGRLDGAESEVQLFLTDVERDLREPTGASVAKDNGDGKGSQSESAVPPNMSDLPEMLAKQTGNPTERGELLPDVKNFRHAIRHKMTVASDAAELGNHNPECAGRAGEFWAGARLDEYHCEAGDDAVRDGHYQAFQKLANQSGEYVFSRLRMDLGAEAPPGFWTEVLRAERSGSFAECWVLFLHVLGWQKSRATRYSCDCEWLEGTSLEDERYCLSSSLPDVVSATTEALLFVMAAHVRSMLEWRCTTHSEDPAQWAKRFGSPPDPSKQMAFSEDLPAREHDLTGSLYELADRLATLAKDLCEQFPLPDVTYGEDSVAYEEIVEELAGSLEEAAQAVWCHPDLGPSHAKDLKQRLHAIQAKAREYRIRLGRTMAGYRRRANRALMIYLREFGRDVKPLYEEIEKQGGLDSGVFTMRLPGVRSQPKTTAAIAETVRSAYTEWEHEEQRCQSDFRDEVLRFIELLTTLNNTIVASCPRVEPTGAVKLAEADDDAGEAGDGTGKPRVAKKLIDGMREFLIAHPGVTFTAKELNRKMQEAGLTSKDYPASDISNAKRHLRDVENLPLVGRSYCYKPEDRSTD